MNMIDVCGTLEYIPREILNYGIHDHTIDIWSLGVLVYEILTGETRFYDDDPDLIELNIINFNFEVQDYINNKAKDFILKTLVLERKDRPDINELINHPLLDEPLAT